MAEILDLGAGWKLELKTTIEQLIVNPNQTADILFKFWQDISKISQVKQDNRAQIYQDTIRGWIKNTVPAARWTGSPDAIYEKMSWDRQKWFIPLFVPMHQTYLHTVWMKIDTENWFAHHWKFFQSSPTTEVAEKIRVMLESIWPKWIEEVPIGWAKIFVMQVLPTSENSRRLFARWIREDLAGWLAESIEANKNMSGEMKQVHADGTNAYLAEYAPDGWLGTISPAMRSDYIATFAPEVQDQVGGIATAGMGGVAPALVVAAGIGLLVMAGRQKKRKGH